MASVKLPLDLLKQILHYASLSTAIDILSISKDTLALQDDPDIWKTNLEIQGFENFDKIKNTKNNWFPLFVLLTDKLGGELIHGEHVVFNGYINTILLQGKFLWILDNMGNVFSTMLPRFNWVRSSLESRAYKIRGGMNDNIVAIIENGRVYELNPINSGSLNIGQVSTNIIDVYFDNNYYWVHENGNIKGSTKPTKILKLTSKWNTRAITDITIKNNKIIVTFDHQETQLTENLTIRYPSHDFPAQFIPDTPEQIRSIQTTPTFARTVFLPDLEYDAERTTDIQREFIQGETEAAEYGIDAY